MLAQVILAAKRGTTGSHIVCGCSIRLPKGYPLHAESKRVTIIIAELGFSSDLGFQKTVDRKQRKYAPLIKALEEEGWTVRPTVHVITAGVRATVPSRNIDVFKSLGIRETSAEKGPICPSTRRRSTPEPNYAPI